MPGSVPRAIEELELLRDRVDFDTDMRELIEILLRLLTSTKLEKTAQEYLERGSRDD